MRWATRPGHTSLEAPQPRVASRVKAIKQLLRRGPAPSETPALFLSFGF